MQDRFSTGLALADTGRAIKARWLQYLLVVAVVGVGLPLGLEQTILPDVDIAAVLSAGASPVVSMVTRLIMLALDTFASGLLIHLTLNAASPARGALPSALGAALATFPALMLLVLILRGPALASQILMWIQMNKVSAGETTMAQIAPAVGLIGAASLLAGLALSMLLVVVKQAAVQEALGPLAAIRRNFDLTRGRRWGMAGLTLLVGCIVGVAEYAVIAAKPALAESGLSAWSVTAFSYASRPVSALATIFFTAVYLELRRLAEGHDRITSVFD
jgi:hypothetical protein